MKKPRKNTASQHQALSPAKSRAFLIITIAFPFVLVLLIEGTLRLFRYGHDLSLVTTEEIGGRDYYVMNGDVKYRYFPSFTFNPSQSPDYFSMKKEPGTYRIFCLGGSTTVGYPYWYNGAFSSFLRVRLRKVFPDRRVEVINMGMTATNSYTALDMARDLVNYEPDLFIVYDGHNEFYGAMGIASNESMGGARWITQLYLRLIRFRTFALLRDTYGRLRLLISGAPEQRSSGTLMERLAEGQYVQYGSSTYARGLGIFEANLRALKELCTENGIPLVVSSQASNLRDQPPFVSPISPGLSPEAQKSLEIARRSSIDEMASGRLDSALFHLGTAVALDSLNADSHYRIAQCLDRLGRFKEARQEYVLARDYDQLRFRTSSDFNSAILRIADTSTTLFADVEKIFNDNSPQGITGDTLMFEHLHPRARGYFLMAQEYARLMRQKGWLAPHQEWERNDTLSEEQMWEDRPVSELDERIAQRRTEILTAGWPFQAQIPIVDPIGTSDTLGHIAEQVTKSRWNWKQAHESAANYYLLRQDLPRAEHEYRIIINQLPGIDVQNYLTLAKVLLDQSKTEEMRAVLLESIAVEPTMLAYRALGDLALRKNMPNEAVGHYQKLLSFRQSPGEQVENGYLLALAYARADSTGKAKDQALQVLRIRPDYKPAVDLLSQISIPR